MPEGGELLGYGYLRLSGLETHLIALQPLRQMESRRTACGHLQPQRTQQHLGRAAVLAGVQLEAGALEILHLQALAVLALRGHARADRIPEQRQARVARPNPQERLA